MQKEATTLWKTMLTVNDHVVPLNKFTQTYIGNILRGICLSLGRDCREVVLYIDDENMMIQTDRGDVPVIRNFAKDIITSTIKGVLSPLKGIFWLQRISINSRLVEKGATLCWPSECDEW